MGSRGRNPFKMSPLCQAVPEWLFSALPSTSPSPLQGDVVLTNRVCSWGEDKSLCSIWGTGWERIEDFCLKVTRHSSENALGREMFRQHHRKLRKLMGQNFMERTF